MPTSAATSCRRRPAGPDSCSRRSAACKISRRAASAVRLRRGVVIRGSEEDYLTPEGNSTSREDLGDGTRAVRGRPEAPPEVDAHGLAERQQQVVVAAIDDVA